MRILLTGKTGQVGGHVARVLAPLGDVHAVDHAAMDLADADTIRRTVRALHPDVIVNAAGYTAVDPAESDADTVRRVNADAPGVLAEEAKRIGAVLVHYSSVYVFDGRKQGAYSEADETNPINEYGRSKLAGERAIQAVGGDFLILRASWVYDTRRRNFLLTMLALAADRHVLHIVDDQVGSPTWARAIAEATAGILHDIDRAREARGIYNVAAEGAVNRYDFIRRALEMREAERQPRLVRIVTSDFLSPAARPLNSVLDTTRLQSVFGLQQSSWEDQLHACLAQISAAQGT